MFFKPAYYYFISILTPFFVILLLAGVTSLFAIAAGFLQTREVGFSGAFFKKKKQKAVIENGEMNISNFCSFKVLAILAKLFVFSLCLYLLIAFYRGLYIDFIRNYSGSLHISYSSRYYWATVFAPFVALIAIIAFMVFRLRENKKIQDAKQIDPNKKNS